MTVQVDSEQSQAPMADSQMEIIVPPSNDDAPICPVVDVIGSDSDKPSSERENVKERATGDGLLKKDAAQEDKPFLSQLKPLFIEKHAVFSLFLSKNQQMTKVEKLTILLVLIMVELFTIGLFYDTDRTQNQEVAV